MNNCEDLEERISEMLLGEVSEQENKELHKHMSSCEGCMEFYLSLYETLECDNMDDMVLALTETQKAKIFAEAKKLDEEIDQQQEEKGEDSEQDEEDLTPIKFSWSFVFKIAAALVVAGVIIRSTSRLPYSAADNPQAMKNAEKVQKTGDVTVALEELSAAEMEISESEPTWQSSSKKIAAAAESSKAEGFASDLVSDKMDPSSSSSPKMFGGRDHGGRSSRKANHYNFTKNAKEDSSDLSGAEDVELALEDTSEDKPVTDDNMDREAVSDVVIKPESYKYDANKRLRKEVEKFDSFEDEEADLAFGDSVDAGKPDYLDKDSDGAGEGDAFDDSGSEELAFDDEATDNKTLRLDNEFKENSSADEAGGSSAKDEKLRYNRGSLIGTISSDQNNKQGQNEELPEAGNVVDSENGKSEKKTSSREKNDGKGSTAGKEEYHAEAEWKWKKSVTRDQDSEKLGDESKNGIALEDKKGDKSAVRDQSVRIVGGANRESVEVETANIDKLVEDTSAGEKDDKSKENLNVAPRSELEVPPRKKSAPQERVSRQQAKSVKEKQTDLDKLKRLEEKLKRDSKKEELSKAAEEKSKELYEQVRKELERRKAQAKKKALEKKQRVDVVRAKKLQKRDFIETASKAQSTFSIDVDTASYQLAKAAILKGRRPDPQTVRAEEFINYFSYGYTAPKTAAFNIASEVTVSPFHRDSHIMRVGVQGRRPGGDHRSASHFCFIVDTSGSMADDGRLPLVKKVLPLIVKQMRPQDRVSLISCGLNSRLELDAVKAENLKVIQQKIETLNARGATNLEASIIDGYKHILNNQQAGVYKRVVLFSDGAANLGEQNADNILKNLEKAREQNVGITVIGMGESDYNDNFLETMANKGDGNYLYIDDNEEVRKAFEENFAATFHTIAYNVKIQVEFDPRQVARYRLLGYENRRLKNKDFRNDKVDAGEVGSGQSVTAIYEVELTENHFSGPLAAVRLRYRDAMDNNMKEQEVKVIPPEAGVDFTKASDATKLAFLAGKFAEVLRAGGNSEGITIERLLKQLRPLSASMNKREVEELVRLVEKSK